MPTQTVSKERQAIDFVLAFGEPIHTTELVEALGFPEPSLKVFLSRGVKAGELQRLEPGRFASAGYVVVDPEDGDVLDEPDPVVIRVEGVIAQEGAPTGDGRMLERGAIVWEGVLPAPLIFDVMDGDHTGMVVGSVIEVERRGDDIWAAALLSQSDDEDVQRAVIRVQELFRDGAVGVSIMLDDDVHEIRVKRELIEEQIQDLEEMDGDGDNWPEEEAENLTEDLAESQGDRVVTYRWAADDALDVTTYGRLRHVAIVDTAAILTDPEKRMAVVASGALTDARWAEFEPYFDDPAFGEPSGDDRLRYDPGTGQWSCPPTVDGTRVYGHVAAWGYCLRGRPDRCVTPPDGDLELFMRHRAPAAGGKRTGVVCVGGGHASTGVGPAEATRFYDQTGRAVADVRVGRDRYGIWFAGMLRPGASEEDVYAFQASDVSGHWEPDAQGRFRLCGLPAVNVGGFPKGVYTYQEVLQGLAASASLDEDCGCEPEPTLADVMKQLKLVQSAVAPLYAQHLLASLEG